MSDFLEPAYSLILRIRKMLSLSCPLYREIRTFYIRALQKEEIAIYTTPNRKGSLVDPTQTPTGLQTQR